MSKDDYRGLQQLDHRSFNAPLTVEQEPLTRKEFHPVKKPVHYNLNRLGIECIQAIEAMLSPEEFIGYLRGNCFKYDWRCRYKGDAIQDLEKSKWYHDLLIQKLKEIKNVQEKNI